MTQGAREILLGFYGDDFTGSTDAMEVTAFAGLRTVLFTRVPDAAMRERFAGYDVIGIASTARARSPDWMERVLPEAFRALAAMRPRIVQYKVCSTFDSSPETGSIGRAIDIGLRVVGGRWSPSIVGAPQLGRWQVFGTLFAAAGGQTYRIDRHPTMSRHPVTPMHEADLRLHLAAQTARPIDSVDLVRLDAFTFEPGAADGEPPVVFLDVVDAASQAAAGRIVWHSTDEMLFSASSSGLQYALVAHWRATGRVAADPPALPPRASVERLLVLSGSCSPVTAEQIARAEQAGFAAIRLDVAATDGDRKCAELQRLEGALAAAFETRRGAIVFAAKTTDDPAFERLKQEAARRGVPFGRAQEELGLLLGELAARVIPRFRLRRVVVAGGDTSGRILEALPVDALEVAHPLYKGAPLCRCHSANAAFDGLQIALKGGQLGGPDAFVEAVG